MEGFREQGVGGVEDGGVPVSTSFQNLVRDLVVAVHGDGDTDTRGNRHRSGSMVVRDLVG